MVIHHVTCSESEMFMSSIQERSQCRKQYKTRPNIFIVLCIQLQHAYITKAKNYSNQSLIIVYSPKTNKQQQQHKLLPSQCGRHHFVPETKT